MDPNTEERLYRADGSFITDGSAVERSTGSVTYDSDLKEDVFTPTGQATCIGGFYYSGLRKNGQYSQSRCMTEEEAEEFGWTSDNLEGLEASTTEPDSGQRMDELQSGKAGKKYSLAGGLSTGCLLPTDPVPGVVVGFKALRWRTVRFRSGTVGSSTTATSGESGHAESSATRS